MSPSSISPLHVGTGQLDCQVLQYVRHIQSTGITRRPPRRKIHTEKKHKKVSKNILYYIRVLQMGFFFSCSFGKKQHTTFDIFASIKPPPQPCLPLNHSPRLSKEDRNQVVD